LSVPKFSFYVSGFTVGSHTNKDDLKAKKQPGDDDMEEDDEKESYVKKHHKGKRAITKARAKSHRAKTKRKKVDKQQRARGTHPKAKKGMANSFKPSAQSPQVKRFKAWQGGNR